MIAFALHDQISHCPWRPILLARPALCPRAWPTWSESTVSTPSAFCFFYTHTFVDATFANELFMHSLNRLCWDLDNYTNEPFSISGAHKRPSHMLSKTYSCPIGLHYPFSLSLTSPVSPGCLGHLKSPLGAHHFCTHHFTQDIQELQNPCAKSALQSRLTHLVGTAPRAHSTFRAPWKKLYFFQNQKEKTF